MVKPGLRDAFSAVDQILRIVKRIEVPDCGYAVFLHQLRMKTDDVARLRIKSDDIDAARKGLQICGCARGLAEVVHHRESVFVGIEVSGLEQSSAAGFKVLNARRRGLLDHRQKIVGKNTGADNRLKTVAECSQHEIDLFHKNSS